MGAFKSRQGWGISPAERPLSGRRIPLPSAAASMALSLVGSGGRRARPPLS